MKLLLTFTTAFYRHTIEAAKAFLNLIKLTLPLGPGMSPADVSWNAVEHQGTEVTSFAEMLSAAEKVLIGMKQSLWSGTYYPILLFDDAERMYKYLDDDCEGRHVLEVVREFFVKNTKEQQNFHILITSTSSVHVRRFLRYIDSRAEVVVIGDLGKEDARQFWEEYLPDKYPAIPVPLLSFKDAYDVFGGYMYHLEQCYFRGIRPELTSIVKLALVRWKIF